MRKRLKSPKKMLGFLLSAAMILETSGFQALAAEMPADLTGEETVYETVSENSVVSENMTVSEGDTANAYDANNMESGLIVQAEGDDIPSGNWNGMVWSIDSDGLLTISGEYEFDSGSGKPAWHTYRDEIIRAEVTASGVTSTANWFDNCLYLESIDFSGFDTSQVTDMSNMFAYCESITVLDLSSFDLSELKDAAGMFYDCRILNRLYTPKNVNIDIYLPYLLQDADGNSYSMLPRGKNASIQLDKGEIIASGTVCGLEWTISGDGEFIIWGTYDPDKDWNEGVDWIDYINVITSAEVNVTGLTWTSDWFNGCVFLEEVDLRGFDASQVTDMSNMFAYCWSLTSLDLSDKDTSLVTDMSDMFAECFKLASLNLSNFKTGRVTNMSGMFAYCESLTGLDLSSFDTSHVTDMSDMFEGCKSLTSLDLSSFDVSGVTYMFSLSDCTSLQQLDTPKNLNKSVALPFAMYDEYGNEYTELPKGRRESIRLTAKAPEFGEILYSGTYMGMNWTISESGFLTVSGEYDTTVGGSGWSQYAQNITRAKVTATGVTSTANWFDNCLYLESIDFSKFDTSQVTDMGSMFSACESLTSLDLSSFNTSQVTDMSYMFWECYSLTNLNLSSFDLSGLEDANGMLNNCTSLVQINTPIHVNMDIKLPRFMQDEEGEVYSTLPRGKSRSYEINKMNPIAFGTYRGMDWSISESGELTISGTYEYDGSEEEGVFWTDFRGFITRAKVTASGVESTREWFSRCSHLVEIDLHEFDTSQVTDMSMMFWQCYSLTSLDVSNFDTSQVTDMSMMFCECYSLTSLDVSNFDTSQVTDMSTMFAYCKSLTSLDLSNIDASQVTDASAMLLACYSLEQLDTPINLDITVSLPVTMYDEYGNEYTELPTGLSESIRLTSQKPDIGQIIYSGTYMGMDWTISDSGLLTISGEYDAMGKGTSWAGYVKYIESAKVTATGVTSTSGWFNKCTYLGTVDLRQFDTSLVTDMSQMFSNCTNLVEVKFGSYSTDNLVDMSQMFYGCTNLGFLDMSSFNTKNVTKVSQMFAKCQSLIELDLSNFDLANCSTAGSMLTGCNALEILYTPRNLKASVALPRFMYDGGGTTYKELPTGLEESILLTSERRPATFRGMTWSIDGSGVLNIEGAYEYDGTEQEKPGWYGQSYTGVKVTATGVKSTYYWFADSALKSVDFSGFDTGSLTDISYMFSGCNSLKTLDLSGFDLAKVEKAEGVLDGCTSLTRLNTPRNLTQTVKLPRILFYEGTEYSELPTGQNESILLTDTVSGTFRGMSWMLDEGKLTASGAYQGDDSTGEPAWLKYVDSITSAELTATDVKDTSKWFYNCSALTSVELSGFDVSQVTDMSSMFEGCAGLAAVKFGDYENKGLVNMSRMFAGCSALTNLDMRRFDLSQMVEANAVFEGCVSLKQIYAPKNLKLEIALPLTMYDESGEEYHALPMNKSVSFWLSDQKEITFEVEFDRNQTYTGKAIKPAVVVTYGSKVLTLNKDYTVSYKNNTNAAIAEEVLANKAPTITVKGKGNYSESITETFNILAMEMTDENTTVSSMVYVYDGKKKQTNPTVTVNGKKLKVNKDFTVEWKDATNDDGTVNENAYKAVGRYDVDIRGTGNYSGELTCKLAILEKNQVPASKLKIASIAAVQLGGEEENLKPEPKVTYGGKTLTLGEDYELNYRDNDKVGKATLILTGLENEDEDGVYVYGTVQKTFNITGTALSKATFRYIGENDEGDEVQKSSYSTEYTGDEIYPEFTMYIREKNPDYVRDEDDPEDQWFITELSEGEDYTVVYTNNVKKGKATMTFTGCGRFTGTLKKTFTIKALSIPKDEVEDRVNIEFVDGDSVSYNQSGAKPAVIVTVDGVELEIGKDCTVSYSNNKKLADADAAKAPTVTVKGKGNYSFKKNATAPFSIVKKNLSDKDIIVTAPDKIIGAKGSLLSTPVVTDGNGKKLKVKTDYTIVGYEMNGEEFKGTETVTAGDIVTITIRGNGNYEGETQVVYRFAEKDISKAKVTAAKLEYTGGEIEFTEKMIEEGMFKVYIPKKGKEPQQDLRYGTDYIITGYKNNIKKGSATVTIQGINEYGGTKAVKFNIVARKLKKE